MSYRKLFAPIILVIFLLSLVPTSLSTPSQGQLKIIGSAWILAPAVAQTQTGMIGSATNISVFVTEGWGDVYVSTYSLTQEDFQGAATAAARVVTRLLGLNFSNYNYYFKVQGDAVIIGGPSAGVAMSIAVYSALTGKPINRSVTVTGMISPDGTVGPVGGVYEKAQAVAQAGAKIFLVPPGQSIVTQYQTVVKRIGPFRYYTTQPVVINLTDYAYKNWGLRVVEVTTLTDALYYFFGVKIPASYTKAPYLSSDAIKIIDNVRSQLIQIAQRELNEAYTKVNASRLTSVGKSTLNSYLDRYAKSYLSRASTRDVSSISLLTSSIAISRWIKLLVDYYSNVQLDQQVQAISDQITATIDELSNKAPRNVLELNILTLSIDKTVQALKLYNESANMWNTDPSTALQNIAFSSALTDEAKAWSNGLQAGVLPDSSQVAATYISVARSTWPYIYSVLSKAGGDLTLIDSSQIYYTLATSLYSSKKPLFAAIAAARSIALAEAAMLYFQAQASGKDPYTEVSRKNAMAVASTYPDMIASIYYLNQSSGAELQDRLAYLKLSSQLGELVQDLLKTINLKETYQQPKQGESTTPSQPSQTPSAPSNPQPSKSIGDWIQDILLKISLAFENLVNWIRKILGL
jgi:uncharacterized protein